MGRSLTRSNIPVERVSITDMCLVARNWCEVQSKYPLTRIEAGTGGDATRYSFCWRFTRGQQSPISSIGLLGEEDWSKLTILQLDVGRIDNTFGVNLLAGKRGEASRFA